MERNLPLTVENGFKLATFRRITINVPAADSGQRLNETNAGDLLVFS